MSNTKSRPNPRVGLNLMRVHELYGDKFEGIVEAARMADELGVDEVHVSDHVAISKSGRAAREGFPYPLEYPWFEPLTVLAGVASRTKRVKLATNILVAPLRPAILLAKQLATLDVMSSGRVEVGFGAGWQREEFDAASIPFASRYSILEEQIEVCRLLWSTAPARYEGPRVQFGDLCSYPFPFQGASLPISLGLHLSPRNLERVVRLGDGWFPQPMEAEALAESLAQIASECVRQQRSLDTLKITAPLALAAHGLTAAEAGIPDPWDEARSLWSAGADVVVAHPFPHCRDADDLHEFILGLVAQKQAAARG